MSITEKVKLMEDYMEKNRLGALSFSPKEKIIKSVKDVKLGLISE